jgi:predicted RNA-binding Zn ribbon-like protein
VTRTQTAPADFRLGLGHIALELAATLGGRRRQPVERLVRPSDLERWFRASNVASDISADDTLLADTRELRDAIHRVLVAAREGEAATGSDVELINRWAAAPIRAPQLDPMLKRTSLDADPGAAALAAIARSAVELITGPELAEMQQCASPSCSLMFIDRSRPGRRRWCSMERCGNRAKTAAYRRRRRALRPR